MRKSRLASVAVTVLALGIAATACSSGKGDSGSSASASGGTTNSAASGATSSGGGAASSAWDNQPNVNSSGTPTKGGTLKIIGNSDVDHLDSSSSYYTVSDSLLRTFTRQLFTSPASPDHATASSIVPDVATEIPTKDNGGISADGTVYTIHIKSGVKWNTQPARQVTAQDFVLGFKRICNPSPNTYGAPNYYIGVIKGMAEYCKAFLKVPQNIASFKDYMTSHDISGIQAVDDSTLKFTLLQPAGDFLNILALQASSAVPVEYLNYMPDDANFRQHTISDGPYQITSYVAGQSYVLKPNPSWSESTDSVRHQYLDEIDITLGATTETVQQQIMAGTQDVEWDTPVPTASLSQLIAAKDPRLGIYNIGSSAPYLPFNLQSPNNNGALAKLGVRQALEYAIDKFAINKIYGGQTMAQPLNGVIPPGNTGYEAFNLYPTPNDQGDPAKCKQMLSDAGYPNGLTITNLYRTSGNYPAAAQSIQQDMAKCGVTVKNMPVKASDFYGKYLTDPAAAKAGLWDIAEPGLIGDWQGNNVRALLQPMLDGRNYGPGASDFMDYNNAQVNADIDKALASTDPAVMQAAAHDADMQAMKDAVMIPIQSVSQPIFRSTRVHNALEDPQTTYYDYTQIWLSPTS